MKIGDKVLVHTFGPHGDIGVTYAVLTITEKRDDVPGSYGSVGNTGYKAVDQYGVSFEFCWDLHPDEAMCPSWFSTGKRDGQVVEEPQSWVFFHYSHRKIVQLIERYPEVVGYCEMHNFTYFKDHGCPECRALKFNNERGVCIDRSQDKVTR